MHRLLGLLLLGLPIACQPGEEAKYAAAGITAGIAVAAAAANRAATGECWGACSHGYGCDEESGQCVPLAELEGAPAPELTDEQDDGCIVEDDGTRVCPDDPPTDVAQLLGLLIELPELQVFFHPGEAPDRVPLRLLKTDALREQPPLTKFGEAVVYVTSTDEPHLAVDRLELNGDRAAIAFRYDVEGVVGTVTFSRSGATWKVERADIAER